MSHRIYVTYMNDCNFERKEIVKLNCWEYKKCGRKPGGEKVKELGVCPASVENVLDGTHGGKNCGRACWIMSGTYCKGQVQGTFAQKYQNCKDCDFYNKVKEEEGGGFNLSAVLLAKLSS